MSIDPVPAEAVTAPVLPLPGNAGLSEDPRSGGEPPASIPEPPLESKLWIEVGVVLAVGWLPWFWSAVWMLLSPRPILALDWCLSEIPLMVSQIVPVLYIMWKSGHGFGHFGLGKPQWRLDGALALLMVILGVGLFPFDWLVYLLLPGRPDELTGPVGNAPLLVLVPSLLVGGFGEELVFRGYLIPRLETLFKSTGSAVMASSILFASYHIYQGAAGAAAILVYGVLYASAFAVIRRVWPLALAHAV